MVIGFLAYYYVPIIFPITGRSADSSHPIEAKDNALIVPGNSNIITPTSLNISGNSNTTLVASGGSIINVGTDAKQVHDAVYQAVQDAMQKMEEERGSDLTKRFPFGYTIFTVTQTKEIVPMQYPDGSDLTADLANSYAETDRNSITVHIANLKTKHFSIGEFVVSLPRKVGIEEKVFGTQDGMIVAGIEKSGDFGDVFVIGIRAR